MQIHKTARLVLASPVLLVFFSCSDMHGPVAPQADPVPGPSFSQSGDGDLLSCPTTETAWVSGNIGMGGGSIQVAGHELVVPKGALPSPQRFSIEVRWSPHLVISFRAEGHEHYEFLKPVTLKLNYSRCEATAESAPDLHVFNVDPASLEILEDVGGVLDPVSNTVAAQTTHLSDYAVGSPQ
jgi:hypothetical protein